MAKVNLFARLLNRGAAIFRNQSIPSDSHPRYQACRKRGIEALAQRRAMDAIEAFGRAALLCPDKPEIHVDLGRALLAAGKIEAARVSYLRALELDPEAKEIHSALLSLPPLPPD